jgi:asparagine synthase (glutamine-hydrolysing)
LLAKDFLGSRPLHYTSEGRSLTWSTVLDPLVLFRDRNHSLDEECIAGWLGSFPAPHLTPYSGIHSVPPSSYVLLKDADVTIRKYWDFDPYKQIRYRCDEEYEEHFRSVFFQSVQRRLCADSPVLAELSGGMDSSSIVCVADRILGEGRAETPRLDTLSYYDDAESSWNERPFFLKVEEQRGRAGCHIDIGTRDIFQLDFGMDSLRASPAAPLDSSNTGKSGLAQFLKSQGCRVVLSGTGGDEVLGGVPTPLPELQDLLLGAHFRSLAERLKIWAIQQRKPLIHLFWEVLQGFLPAAFTSVPTHWRPAPWLDREFVRRNRQALVGYPSRIRFLGPTPTFQENLNTLEALRRQLGTTVGSANPPFEKRYPCLDRDLLEFLYAIPRNQLVRPGQRRSLLRRALTGIVPAEILGRKRKAFVSRAPLAAMSREWSDLRRMSERMLLASLGMIRPDPFREALDKARAGRDVPMVALLRTIAIELWLRNLIHHGLSFDREVKTVSPMWALAVKSVISRTNDFSAEKNHQQKGGETRELSKT